eukprot:3121902-Prymnesium_polylepis.1
MGKVRDASMASERKTQTYSRRMAMYGCVDLRIAHGTGVHVHWERAGVWMRGLKKSARHSNWPTLLIWQRTLGACRRMDVWTFEGTRTGRLLRASLRSVG